jgi:negative regulator of sigma E activity
MRGLRLQQAKPLWSSSMSERSPDDAVPREILSALADGQAHPDEVARACAAWRQQPGARATWHAYHLIGEAMRSPDQAAASDSAAFLQRMRARLAEEPVVLSPQSAQSVGRGAAPQAPVNASSAALAQPLKRRMWAGPMAVAASFAAIVGMLTANLGGTIGQPEGTQVARSGVGWAEGGAQSAGMASALMGGGSFSAARTQAHAWLPSDPRLEQAMSVQRPQPSPPQTFAEAPGVIRVSVGQDR